MAVVSVSCSSSPGVVVAVAGRGAVGRGAVGRGRGGRGFAVFEDGPALPVPPVGASEPAVAVSAAVAVLEGDQKPVVVGHDCDGGGRLAEEDAG